MVQKIHPKRGPGGLQVVPLSCNFKKGSLLSISEEVLVYPADSNMIIISG